MRRALLCIVVSGVEEYSCYTSRQHCKHVLQPCGTGKTLAAIYCAIYLKSPYTCIFAETVTHEGIRRDIKSVDPNARFVACRLICDNLMQPLVLAAG